MQVGLCISSTSRSTGRENSDEMGSRKVDGNRGDHDHGGQYSRVMGLADLSAGSISSGTGSRFRDGAIGRREFFQLAVPVPWSWEKELNDKGLMVETRGSGDSGSQD